MSKEIKIAGSISFGGKRLNVYGDLDAPLFKAKDISHAIGYSSGNEWRMLEMCEEDEKLKLPLVHPCTESYGNRKILETCGA